MRLVGGKQNVKIEDLGILELCMAWALDTSVTCPASLLQAAKFYNKF